MPRLKLEHAIILKPKADFMKHAIGFTVNIPLTDENLKLRDRFVLLAQDGQSVTVEIESPQLPLFDDGATAENIIADPDKPTAPGAFKAEFEQAATEIYGLGHPETIKREREERPGIESVTFSSGGKSVTIDSVTRNLADAILKKRTARGGTRGTRKNKKRA